MSYRDMTLPEYSALLDGWNRTDQSGDVEPPDPAHWQREQERLRNSPHITHAAPKDA